MPGKPSRCAGRMALAALSALFIIGCGGGGGGTTASAPSGPSGSLRLEWNTNTEPDMDHYLVYYDNVSRSSLPYPNPPKSVPKQSTGTTTYVLTGLVPGTTYYVRVSAVDTGGAESPLSEEVNGSAQ